MTPGELPSRSVQGLLAEDHSYQAAGEAMGTRVDTVRNHARSIHDKLRLPSRSAAVTLISSRVTTAEPIFGLPLHPEFKLY